MTHSAKTANEVPNVTTQLDQDTGILRLSVEDFEQHRGYFLAALHVGLAKSLELTADPELEMPCLAVVPAKDAPADNGTIPVYAIADSFQFAAFGMVRTGTPAYITRNCRPEAYVMPMVTLE